MVAVNKEAAGPRVPSGQIEVITLKESHSPP